MRAPRILCWSLILSAALASASASAEPRTPGALVLTPPPAALFPDSQEASAQTQSVSGGVTVLVTKGTEYDKAPSTSLLLTPGGQTTPTHVYRLHRGRLDVRIPKNQLNKVAVLVIGPTGQSCVMRAGHNVALAAPGSIGFTALEHEMLTGKGSHWRALAPGLTRTIDLERGVTEETKVLASPGVSVTNPLVLADPASGFQAQVNLEPLAGADRFQVTLLRRNGAALSVVSHTESRKPSVRLSGSGPGTYAIVARALDASGIASSVSAPVPLRAFGVKLPEGSERVGEQVLLAPRQRISLVAAEGLKMTYGNGSYFVDAPHSIGLSRGATTAVRFREPGSENEVKLTLVPQVLRAEVTIGPRSARWPRDTVEVTVRTVDSAGKPVKDMERVTTRVSVNLEPVAMRWTRRGDSLTGTVRRPTSMQGPWVVRVEVENEFGDLIGRDFLEIVGNASSGAVARQ